jgi:arginyl-tRNA synthetase
MLRIAHLLEAQLRAAMERALPAAAQPLDPQLAPASKPEFGDFQANGALPLAKPLGQPPRQIAQAIVQQLAADPAFGELCLEPVIAGPGFINLTLRPERLAAEVAARLGDPRLGVPTAADEAGGQAPAPVIVDFSSPNIAKEMHVGHLRSTIIGDCLARVLEFRGHPVLRLNHVGDWGTQFGMLITHLKQVAPEALTTADAVDLGDLVAFYRQAKARFDDDEAFQATSREEVVKLQGGDPVSLKAWGLLCDQSRREFQKIYDRLHIALQERGESFYNPQLQAVVDDLRDAGLLVVDAGAGCVFLEGVSGKDGQPLPLIVQKSDGGFNYATTDLAAIRYRFAAAPAGDGASVEHVPFGLVQGEDGKKLKSRAGDIPVLTARMTSVSSTLPPPADALAQLCGQQWRNKLRRSRTCTEDATKRQVLDREAAHLCAHPAQRSRVAQPVGPVGNRTGPPRDRDGVPVGRSELQCGEGEACRESRIGQGQKLAPHEEVGRQIA